MNDYRYVLIRYVADRERMEPVNVGLILQGQGRLDLRFSPHAAKRKDVDTESFRRWKDFFRDEIHGPEAPLFQPERVSSAFLHYLEQLCEGPIVLSRSLTFSSEPTRTFDQNLDELYQRLVAPPEIVSATAATRPTGRFRQIAEEKRFLHRGLRRHAPIVVDNHRLWMAYRQLANGEVIAFDKVEVANLIGSTANEIERLPLIGERLGDFVGRQIDGKQTRYFLLADELSKPFTDQPEEDFKAMLDAMETGISRIAEKGGQIIRSSRDAESFAEELDHKLAQEDRLG